MPRRELNNHNTAKRMTETFGHSDNLITLSLSLSQALAYKRGNNTFYFTRGSPASIYGFSCVHAREVGLFFLSPSNNCGGGQTLGNKHLSLTNKFNHLKTKQ